MCAPSADAATTFLAGTRALVVDLRETGGGSPAMVACVSWYLFDRRTHLDDLWARRTGATEQFWTRGRVPGRRLGSAKPAYVLTAHTFSGAYDPHPTPGASLPIVTPRLTTLATALALAGAMPARASAQAPAPQPATRTAAPAPAARDLPLTDGERQAYVGTYSGTLPQGGTGLVRVYLRGDTLRMSRSDDSRAPRLLYQGGHVFRAEGVPDFVIDFAVEKGRATGFSVQKDDGVLRATRVPAGTP